MKRTVSTLLTASVLSLSLVFSLTAYGSGRISDVQPTAPGKLSAAPAPSSSAIGSAAQISDPSAMQPVSITDAGPLLEGNSGIQQHFTRKTDNMAAYENENTPAEASAERSGTQTDAASHTHDAALQEKINAAGSAAYAGRIPADNDKGVITENRRGGKNAILPGAPLRATLACTLSPPGIGKTDVPIAASSIRRFWDVISQNGENTGAAAVKIPCGAKRLPQANYSMDFRSVFRPSYWDTVQRTANAHRTLAACFTRAPPLLPFLLRDLTGKGMGVKGL